MAGSSPLQPPHPPPSPPNSSRFYQQKWIVLRANNSGERGPEWMQPAKPQRYFSFLWQT